MKDLFFLLILCFHIVSGLFAPSPCPLGTFFLLFSPQVLRSDEYSESADVYSFGICCWELATASRPFRGMKTVKVLHDVAYEGLRPNMQEEQEAATPDWLVFLMGKCWVNIPSERPSFSEILSFIEDEMRKMELEEEEETRRKGDAGGDAAAPKRKLSREEMEADWSKRLGVIPRQQRENGEKIPEKVDGGGVGGKGGGEKGHGAVRAKDSPVEDPRKWASTAY